MPRDSEWILSSQHPSAMGSKLSPNEKVWAHSITAKNKTLFSDQTQSGAPFFCVLWWYLYYILVHTEVSTQ